MSTGKEKVISVDSMFKGFRGWHVGSGANGNTIGAVVPLSYLKTLIDANSDIKPASNEASSSNIDKFYHFLGKSLPGTSTHTAFDRKYAIVVPAVVWVRGSSLTAAATLCFINEYVQVTPMFHLVVSKTISAIRASYDRWHASRGAHDEYASDFVVPTNCTAMKIRNKTLRLDLSSVDFIRLYLERDECSVYLLIDTVQIMRTCTGMDEDAGQKFRDKLGRQAGHRSLEMSIQAFLFTPETETETEK